MPPPPLSLCLMVHKYITVSLMAVRLGTLCYSKASCLENIISFLIAILLGLGELEENPKTRITCFLRSRHFYCS